MDRSKKVVIGIGVLLVLALVGSSMDDPVDEAAGRDDPVDEAEAEAEVEQPAPQAEPANTTSSGLSPTWAQAACDRQGKAEFPYGFRGHWILGKLAEEIVDDRWFLKVEATVKNEFGAERRMNVECFVEGTNEAPVVETFLAY